MICVSILIIKKKNKYIFINKCVHGFNAELSIIVTVINTLSIMIRLISPVFGVYVV